MTHYWFFIQLKRKIAMDVFYLLTGKILIFVTIIPLSWKSIGMYYVGTLTFVHQGDSHITLSFFNCHMEYVIHEIKQRDESESRA